ncbi:two-component system LytT family sensor kinase/two-component system sensor histidine kinase LytS [Scopulibacillus darangshiensis]|uniref:Two-component system LytT family sensor kinase/two-component system sensor histidine kinase LytS n=1 Tax=Scopulibacillus darangshiensis TaxID=442528 RepID=A0A4R2NJM5_9BACL|nr:LytS/YhcK type 5TM receptor domain-containing protein [Scopulibacillus darangshiensis]TCP21660.1 two-component system LytT family sensor kinase/two-component system sensor histidine kinase LytS [Scopulibacillus darangshiensis]
MWDLLTQMVGRMCIIVTIAFLITRFRMFRQLIHKRMTWRDRAVMTLIFGIFGLIGNYIGIVVTPDSSILSAILNNQLGTFSAIADTRNIGVIIGGMLGGPIVGTAVGLIAGGDRYLLGGFIPWPVFITTVLGGVMAGFVGKRLSLEKAFQPLLVSGVSVVILTIQITMIPILSDAHRKALNLVEFTGVPIILVNGIGIWLFMLILQSVWREEERTRAFQTEEALFIAGQTLPFFRQGLNSEACTKAVDIICRLTEADAVAITDKKSELARTGKGQNVHIPEENEEQEMITEVLETGRTVMSKSQGKTRWLSPLNVVMVVPLKIRKKPVGAIIFYFLRSYRLSRVEQQLADGLATLFSTQLELGEAERHANLLKDAKIKALQAQIEPHFLFNSLNVIAALCRPDPVLAKGLIARLGTYLRSNLKGSQQTFITVAREMENVEAYLSLEQARFPDRFVLNKEIEAGLDCALLPPFTVQPLVENAIRHGFSNTKEKGTIDIIINHSEDKLTLTIADDGTGVTKDKASALGEMKVASETGNGSALFNIKERLSALYGCEGSIQIDSEKGTGMRVVVKVPLQYEKKGEGSYAKGEII